MPAGLGQKEVFGGDQSEGGIAEVFKALVVVRGVGGMFGDPGGVGQGGAQEGGVGEGVAEALLQRPGGGIGAVWDGRVQGWAASRRSTVKERSLPRRSRATTAPLRSRR